MRSAGTNPAGLVASSLIESATSASLQSGEIAMLDGGPTTLLLTLSIWLTRGGHCEKSRTVSESELASAPATALGAPLVSSILRSLPEMTICARAQAAK